MEPEEKTAVVIVAKDKFGNVMFERTREDVSESDIDEVLSQLQREFLDDPSSENSYRVDISLIREGYEGL